MRVVDKKPNHAKVEIVNKHMNSFNCEKQVSHAPHPGQLGCFCVFKTN